jgi:hypothetical protein
MKALVNKSKLKQKQSNKRKLKSEKEKKIFVGNMHLLIDCFGGKGAYDLIPKNVINQIYQQRVLPLEIKFSHASIYAEGFRQLLQKTMEFMMRNKKSLFQIDDLSFQPDILLTAGGTVIKFMNFLMSNTEDSKWVNQLNARINHAKFEELMHNAANHLNQMVELFYLYTVDLSVNVNVIWFKYETIPPHNGSGQEVQILNVNVEDAVPKYFHTTTGKRPAFPVVWPQTQKGLKYYTIEPSLFGAEFATNEPARVYIQRHAIQRLIERLDCLGMHFIQHSLCCSLQESIVERKNDNTVLISYFTGKTKLGYLVAEYIDGDVLIHTFLFITANGTPEGQKLNKLSGLGKRDKEHLGIDKLSTFMNSDISKNEYLKTLFKKSDCSCLIEIDNAVKDISNNKNDEELILGDKIINYLDIRTNLQNMHNNKVYDD